MLSKQEYDEIKKTIGHFGTRGFNIINGQVSN